MQITMEALEQAFAPIEALGKGEIIFKVNGTSVTLRRLLPEEESEAQKFAVMKSDDENSNALEYIQRFKLAIISYALVAVGPLDLRDVQYVETGEKLDTGIAIKVARHVAMRKMLLKWAAPARIAMFRQYVELLNQVEDRAEEMVEFAPTNLDGEIERLEKRIESLRERQAAEKDSLESDVSKLVKTIHQKEAEEASTQDDSDDPEMDEPVVTPEPVAVAPEPVKAPVARQSSIPQVARPVAPSPQPVQVPPQPVQPTKPPRPNPSDYAAGMDVPDSFVDFGDSGSMEDAVAAENLRMLHQRQAVARGQDPQGTPSVLSAAHSMRRPPHMAARQPQGELDGGELSDELLYSGRTVDGVDTYRMAPPESLVGYTPEQLSTKGNPVVPKGVNPRFTPPKKP